MGIYAMVHLSPFVIKFHDIMKRLYDEAEAEKDPDIRLRLYLDACDCYTGEFLPL